MGTGILSSLRAANIDGGLTVEAVRRAMREITGGGDIQVVDAPNGVNAYRVPGLGHISQLGPAVITDAGPDGEADKDDASYWVKPHRPAAGNTTKAAILEPFAEDGKSIQLATNLAELDVLDGTTGTHLLPVDAVVWLWIFQDANGADRLLFDRAVPNPFVVYVTIDSAPGTEGSNATTCTLTYSATDKPGGTVIDTALTPDAPARYANCEYQQVAADSPAIGYYDNSNTFKLLLVPGEIPVGDVVTMQEQRLNGLDIEVRTRDVLVLESADWGDWAVLDEGTECP